MTGSRSSNDDKPGQVANTDGEDSDDEESEILEESPCGRWVKRREVVDQRDVPGIDCAYLAMDTEEGVEVVWNEVRFSERKNLKAQEEKIRQVFDNLTQLEHPNIVKFHKYWMETNTDKPRVVFITEYMSSGSLKQFLKRTKKNVKRLPLQGWKRWCTQILSALRYLHSCSPPIIHGNLTCDTIFIQHNGLVKIGSVAPDAIHHHVKSCRDNIKNMHFVAPEYSKSSSSLTSKADIYSFGMCALEMAALEIQGNGDSGTAVTEDHINRTIESLEQDETPLHDFIKKCLNNEPQDRPTAQDLLFHPVLFEVPSLKLLSAHALLSSVGCQNLSNISETISDEVLLRHYGPNVIVAEIKHTTSAESEDGQESQLTSVQWKMSDVPVSEKLEKFVEDVKFGIYPLTCFELPQPLPPRQQASRSPEVIDSVKSTSPEPFDNENRRVVNMMCNVKPRDEGPGLLCTILVRMDDKMNRQLSTIVDETDTPFDLANELIYHGFINEADRDKLANLIDNRLNGIERTSQSSNSNIPSPPTLAPHGINGSPVFYPVPVSSLPINPVS
ncbi:nuclear receptor-binding protein isoform X1 [Folsomia candida]|uniref:nuclear receptor-binding protein isoform X1 n=1 Tax=Folsomia candida TaxID=158441 RepID=UPI000B8F6050|nr:nuclear receptor-binding protein isoform X1 [Folsomia candida]XP_035702889.1 nuclear receptor-binding protein isoform X1 [Folsomia candida]